MIPKMNHDWTAKWALYQPDQIAFKDADSGQSLSYANLNRLANRLAHKLQRDCGLQAGDRIAVLSENSLEYILFCRRGSHS